MTFFGLVLRFAIGYVCGLLAKPFLSRPFSKFGDVSVRGGIAGALGASVTYLLLNSIWYERMPRALIRHEHWVSAAACLFAIAGVEIVAGSESRTTTAEPVAAARASKRKAVTWLWFCGPALVYRLWRQFFGEPFHNPLIIYIIGGLAVIGLVGYLVVYSVSYLRATE